MGRVWVDEQSVGIFSVPYGTDMSGYSNPDPEQYYTIYCDHCGSFDVSEICYDHLIETPWKADSYQGGRSWKQILQGKRKHRRLIYYRAYVICNNCKRQVSAIGYSNPRELSHEDAPTNCRKYTDYEMNRLDAEFKWEKKVF